MPLAQRVCGDSRVQINPAVTDERNYIGIEAGDLGVDYSAENLTDLIEFTSLLRK